MTTTTDWVKQLRSLLTKYAGTKHPLNFKNTYQLLISVLLAAQDRDDHINKVTPTFFKLYPTISALAKAEPEQLNEPLKGVRGGLKKAGWLVAIARELKNDKNIPTTLAGLTALPGIGRKTANVILRESGAVAEGIIVDLHVVRVAPRLGISPSFKDDGPKIEQHLMELLPQKMWGDIGMAFSHLGRETCRPTDPKCDECVMAQSCDFHLSVEKE